jgi:tripartite-type tricarboxylate transporter receptor subunit TctC
MAHVAYRGEAPAINDLLGGQIPLMFANLSAVMGNIKAGRLHALAVAGARRSAALPDVPTVAETLPGFEAATWFALVAPAATPQDVIVQLNLNVQRALAQTDVQQRFAELGMSGEASTPDQLDAYIRSEIAKWTKVIKDAGIEAAE